MGVFSKAEDELGSPESNEIFMLKQQIARLNFMVKQCNIEEIEKSEKDYKLAIDKMHLELNRLKQENSILKIRLENKEK